MQAVSLRQAVRAWVRARSTINTPKINNQPVNQSVNQPINHYFLVPPEPRDTHMHTSTLHFFVNQRQQNNSRGRTSGTEIQTDTKGHTSSSENKRTSESRPVSVDNDVFLGSGEPEPNVNQDVIWITSIRGSESKLLQVSRLVLRLLVNHNGDSF